ncbi:MAG: ferrochelatase [Pseudomonadota bacterium]|nr:ferrochelatase [Pseudomonadota bacterium]
MRRQGERRGVLLMNLGTPDAPDTAAVGRYLRQFLMDGRVLDIPTPARWMLVNLAIVPTRSPKSAKAYRAIWRADGSPLLVHSRALAQAVERELGEHVSLAMRYGNPSIEAAIRELGEVDRIVVVPLYPQYASSSTGTALEALFAALSERVYVPPVTVMPPFFDDPGFLDAQAALARPLVDSVDHVLFSYHSLPERHIRAASPRCELTAACCAPASGTVPAYCYRAQCLATTRGLVARLGLAEGAFSESFQSRLGREQWLKPATDKVVPDLARRGVKRLAVVCPSFVSDCLETLEEIGVRARDEFLEAGGEELRLVPCVNAEPTWAAALARRIASM